MKRRVSAFLIFSALCACAPDHQTEAATTRGAVCDQLAAIADDGTGWPLICLDTKAGRVWSLAGIDTQVPMTKAAANSHCSNVGALTHDKADGMLMVCTMNNTDLPPNERQQGQ